MDLLYIDRAEQLLAAGWDTDDLDRDLIDVRNIAHLLGTIKGKLRPRFTGIGPHAREW